MTEEERAAVLESMIKIADAILSKKLEDAQEACARLTRDAYKEHEEAVRKLRDDFDRMAKEW